MKPYLLYIFMVIALVLTGCGEKGCRNINALNFDPEAVKEDGSCKYLVLQNISLESIPTSNSAGIDWDDESTADLLIKLSNPSASEKFSSKVLFNASFPASIDAEEEVIFTNEEWSYELYDYDVPGPDALITTGSFNPIKARSNNEITISNGSTRFKLQCNEVEK